MIDLRSDTVTRPTPGMMKAMMNAPVGDDVFNDDPSVHALQDDVATLLNKEDALFVPSGTMANQLALRCSTQPGDSIVLESGAHIANYEAGASAVLSGLTLIRVPGAKGILNPTDVWKQTDVSPDVHCPPISILAVENTANAGGGFVYPQEIIEELTTGGRQRGLHVHLDGARLWNAEAKTGTPPSELVKGFDSVSVCLSKGLGAPVGSVLAGSKDLINRARRFRKMLGGGMRQAGFIAAAGRYALHNHRERMTEDHRRAQALYEAFKNQGWAVQRPDTNMVYVKTDSPAALKRSAAENGVLFAGHGNKVRLVLHLDINDQDVEKVILTFSHLAQHNKALQVAS